MQKLFASSRLCRTLGLKLPLFQAPMAGVSTVQMAAAVIQNGGLGSIPLGGVDLRKGVGLLKSSVDQLIDLVGKENLVNFNFFCHDIVDSPSVSQTANWWSLYTKTIGDLDSFKDFVSFDNSNVSFKELELNFPDQFNELMDYLEITRPKITSFHFGHPSKETIKRLQNLGILVFITTTSIEETRHLIELNVDGLICQGYEAGGHRGNFLTFDPFDEHLSTQALFIQTRDYIYKRKLDTYIVPTGGIMDSVTMKYYLDNGADSIQLGSIFLGTPESTSAPFFSNALASKNHTPTIMTPLVSGKPARTVSTPFIQDLIECNCFDLQELPPYGCSYSAYKLLRPKIEGIDIGFYLAGQHYHSMETSLSTAQIVQKLAKELQQL